MAETPGSGAGGSAGDGAPGPQRRWTAACPNCGAPVPFTSASAAVAICEFCRSTVLRDGDSLRKIGESAELFDDHTPLQLGVNGRDGARGFTVVGRVQMGTGSGDAVATRWNEWYLAFDDGRDGWLSEDNDQYVLVFEMEPDGPPPTEAQLKIGGDVWLVGVHFRVASVVEARPLAAQGQLKAPPALGERYPVADLRSETGQVATLDYADQDKPVLSIGKAVRLDTLSLHGLREDYAGSSAKTVGTQQFNCPECGAPITPSLSSTQSLTCNNCHSVVDISKGPGADLTAFKQARRYEPVIPLGRTGALAVGGGAVFDWQVVGFSIKAANAGSPSESFTWADYLLYNEHEGFAFLVDSEDGWTGFRTMTGVPVSGNGATADYGGNRYRCTDEYPATTRYVEGEFYWQVRRTQVVQTADYVGTGTASNQRLSSESTAEEIVWSKGEVILSGTIEAAFRIHDRQRAGAMPNVSPVSGGQMTSWVVWLIVILVILFVLSRCDGDGGGVFLGTGGGSYGGYSSGGGHK